MLLQPRINVKISQRQVLTPSLMQMVSVLALNKLELKEMLNGEMIENPVLEEVEDGEQSFDERAGEEGDRERSAEERTAEAASPEKDPFDEIDFGSYFQDYLDPGYRTGSNFEEFDKPSFEHFLSKPSTLPDHLLWQLGSLSLRTEMREAAERVVGNLNEDGYLTASVEELGGDTRLMAEAVGCVQGLDPVGVGARTLQECLLLQLAAQEAAAEEWGGVDFQAIEDARSIVENCLPLLQRKDMRELCKALKATAEAAQNAVDLIRRLDPRPGQRYNQAETRLIEPDLAFIKRDEDWVVLMNEDDLPALRLNGNYRRMLREKKTDKEVREYVKERYKAAIQLLRNIEQRKNTIVRVGEAIVRRQQDFLERGVDALHPMMIKEVAEEIGVHASTVSRAVANKYVHTAQGVYELRFFFSEGVGGPEGGDLPLPLLKKRVRKLIEDENSRKPFTDEQLAAELQSQGIQVTRRTVAKYREDMGIPSTHQRRVR